MKSGTVLGGARNAKRAEGSSGRSYPSKLERDRAEELRLLERAGKIADLEEQPYIRNLHAGIGYRPDFVYTEEGVRIWEDAKGVQSDRFRLILKLWALHGPGPLRVSGRLSRRGGIGILQEVKPRDVIE